MVARQEVETPEERWRNLRENGSKLLVNLQSNESIADKPIWFDELKFARAKEVCTKFRIGIQYSSFTGLLLILQLPDGLEPLLSTGNSKDIPSLYRRYLSTVVHVVSWYDDDVFNPSTKGYKSIRQVRAMHKRVQALMNEKFTVPDVEGAPRKWLNQYDMAMTQFAFIGMALLYPKKSGMIAASEQDLELVNYYWRVLGYLMGIDDQYNLCHFDRYADIVAFHRLIFDREYKDSFDKFPCQMGLEMTQAICLAMHYFMPLVRFNNLAHWWKDCFHFNGYQPKPLTAVESVLDFWSNLAFNHLFKHEGFLKFSNKLHKKRFEQRLKNKEKVYEKLVAQYRDQKKFTYYSEREDYFTKQACQKAAHLEPDKNNNGSPANLKLGSCPFGYGTAAPLRQVSLEPEAVAS